MALISSALLSILASMSTILLCLLFTNEFVPGQSLISYKHVHHTNHKLSVTGID